MVYLQDPIILILAALLIISAAVSSYPRRRPELWLIALTIMLFAIPRAGFMVPGLNLPLPLAHILALAVIIQWLFLGQNQYRSLPHFGLPFLFYAAVVGWALVRGISTGGDYTIAILELFVYLISMGLFFYAGDIFSRPRLFLRFIGLVLIISVAVSLYGIAQKWLAGTILIDYVTYNSASELARSYIEQSNISMRRVLSSYGDPNVLACQLLIFVGISLSLVLNKGVSGGIRLLCLMVLGVNVLCTIFTGSRAGMIAMAIVALIVLTFRWRWVLLALPILMVLAFIFVPPMLDAALSARFDGVISADDARAQFPAMAWQLLKTAPLGCGLGNMVSLQFEGFNWSFTIIPTSNVWGGINSFWLNLLSQLGIPGLIIFSFLIITLLRHIWRQAKHIDHPLAKSAILGALAGVLGQSLVWLVNNTYMLPGGSLNYWFMMGMMVAGCRAFAPQPAVVMLPLQQRYPFGKPAPA